MDAQYLVACQQRYVRLFQCQFGRTGNHCHWRAQFMAGSSDEGLLPFDELLVALQVATEGVGDDDDLGTRTLRNRHPLPRDFRSQFRHLP